MFASRRLLRANVAVLGAAGGIGQPLSLLLKINPLVSKLSLFDIDRAHGVAVDLSHISTPATVTGYDGDQTQLMKSLEGAEIVVIPAGVPRKEGMTRDDLFNSNAEVVYKLTTAIAKTCPNAAVLLITNPVNSTVPIAAEVLKSHGVYNKHKLFGVSTLDLVRAKTFIHTLRGIDFDVPVIGGHSGPTIVPLLSQVPSHNLSSDEIEKLTHRIQYAGEEVVKAKKVGSATLSMAYAGSRFVNSMLKASQGEKVTEWAFVETDVEKELPFFATKIELGNHQWTKALPVPSGLSTFEQQKYKECVEQLKKDIKKGIDFGKSKSK